LPELLLAGLVEEGEVADMVDEDVAEDGQFGVFGGDFARVGAEGGTEAAESGGRVKFGDFVLRLLG